MAARKRKLFVDQKTKDEIRGTQLVNLLTEYAKSGTFNGQPVDSNRIAAARAALPFLRPTLASIEQTTINPADQVSESQRINNLVSILRSNPDLLPRLAALVNAPVEPAPLAPPSQVTH